MRTLVRRIKSMNLPFRDDRSALETRHDALERELAQLREQKRALDGLDAREQELARQLEETRAHLAGKGGSLGPERRRLLDSVRIASPCSASWDTMQGNDRARFCLQCEKNVYNLSAMSRDEAEALLGSQGELCVRLYRRADDTVMTADCPVGMKIRYAKKRKRAWLGIGATVFSASLAAVWIARAGSHRMGTAPMPVPDGAGTAMGSPVPISPPEPAPTSAPTTTPGADGHHMMGALPPIQPRDKQHKDSLP